MKEDSLERSYMPPGAYMCMGCFNMVYCYQMKKVGACAQLSFARSDLGSGHDVWKCLDDPNSCLLRQWVESPDTYQNT